MAGPAFSIPFLARFNDHLAKYRRDVEENPDMRALSHVNTDQVPFAVREEILQLPFCRTLAGDVLKLIRLFDVILDEMYNGMWVCDHWQSGLDDAIQLYCTREFNDTDERRLEKLQDCQGDRLETRGLSFFAITLLCFFSLKGPGNR